MSISITTSNKASNASATTTLVLPAFSSTASQRIILGIAILDTTQSVTVITDTAGSTYQFLWAEVNGTGVRVEMWFCNGVNANVSNVITIGFTGATLASAAFGEYAGATGFGARGNSHATNASLTQVSNMSGSSDWVVAVFGIASSSGDTVAAGQGTIRQSLIPALTTAGIVLMDNTSVITSTLPCSATLSASRAWAAVAIDLTSGLPAASVSTSNFTLITNADGSSFHQVMKTPSQSSSTGGGGNSGYVS